jgi:hypothetical protein
VRSRVLASVAVAAAVALGATGCEFMTSADTQHIKDITDGVNVSVGKVDVRNALLITRKGTNARFIATVVNNSNDPQTLSIQAKGGLTDTVDVPANSTLDLAKPANDITFRGIDVKPGSLSKVFFTYAGATGASAGVPVLNGQMEEYSTLLPTAPSPTPTGTATSTPSPSDSATAATNG